VYCNHCILLYLLFYFLYCLIPLKIIVNLLSVSYIFVIKVSSSKKKEMHDWIMEWIGWKQIKCCKNKMVIWLEVYFSHHVKLCWSILRLLEVLNVMLLLLLMMMLQILLLTVRLKNVTCCGIHAVLRRNTITRWILEEKKTFELRESTNDRKPFVAQSSKGSSSIEYSAIYIWTYVLFFCSGC